MPYLKGDAPSQLDVYVPKITRAYITSRLESVQAVVVGGGEDPLDNEEQLQVGGSRGGGGGGRGGKGRRQGTGPPGRRYVSSCAASLCPATEQL
jgi:hypothetical protein